MTPPPRSVPPVDRSPLRQLIDRHQAGSIDDVAFVAAVVELDPQPPARERTRPDDVLDEVWAETALGDFPEPGTLDEILAAAFDGSLTRPLRDVVLDRLARRAG